MQGRPLFVFARAPNSKCSHGEERLSRVRKTTPTYVVSRRSLNSVGQFAPLSMSGDIQGSTHCKTSSIQDLNASAAVRLRSSDQLRNTFMEPPRLRPCFG